MVVRGLHQTEPHVKENLGHWGHKKGEKPGHCSSRGKEMQEKHKSGRFIHGPAL